MTFKLPIRKRLTLLIFTLLSAVIISYTAVSFIGIRKASMKAGRLRLESIATQLREMFGGSAQVFLGYAKNLAGRDTIKQFIANRNLKAETLKILETSHLDSSSIQVELLDKDLNPILSSKRFNIELNIDKKNILSQYPLKGNNAVIGKFFQVNDSLYYPILSTVTDHDTIIGYIARWRLMHATKAAIEQFSGLLGPGARLYISTTERRLWTDLGRPLNPDTASLVTATTTIPGSPWIALVGFPKKTILEPSSNFLKTSIIIGTLILLIAMIAALITSQNIIKPLQKLTTAAESISGGDYETHVNLRQGDELGKLALAFNTMSDQIKIARNGLEHQVQERTEQLRASNKELEAFSYSVSHDLRAPLRAISGYSMILKEDYSTKLGDEAIRLTDKIINNAQMMGQLIDSLIAFSQMGAAEIIKQKVDMDKMAHECAKEIIAHQPAGKYKIQVQPLHPCKGDPNLIRQVWTNLISNAVKYASKSASPTITLGCTEGKEMHIYFITDNGVGFDMQYAHKLFGVFQRLHNQRDYEGTGIGLAFTKRIINKHGGDIWAESKPNEVTTFFFSLPVYKPENKFNEHQPGDLIGRG